VHDAEDLLSAGQQGAGSGTSPGAGGQILHVRNAHGGIAFQLGALDWVEQAFGPAGSDIFAPPKMYGYLTPGATFGDPPPDGTKWDPQELPGDVFSADDVFCLIGTDPKDYGLPRVAVGPRATELGGARRQRSV
jgi:hypothetical protein